MLSGSFHPVADLINTWNVVNLGLSLFLLNLLDHRLILIGQRIEGHVISATLNLIVLSCFLATVLEPPLLLKGVKIDIAITSGNLLLLAGVLVVQCLGSKGAFGNFFLLKFKFLSLNLGLTHFGDQENLNFVDK